MSTSGWVWAGVSTHRGICLDDVNNPFPGVVVSVLLYLDVLMAHGNLQGTYWG